MQRNWFCLSEGHEFRRFSRPRENTVRPALFSLKWRGNHCGAHSTAARCGAGCPSANKKFAARPNVFATSTKVVAATSKIFLAAIITVCRMETWAVRCRTSGDEV